MHSDRISTSSSRLRPAAKQHVDDLIEIVEPERQLDVAGIEHQRVFAEAAAIFVVHVKQQHAKIGPRRQDLVQQQRHGARFADAGRAEHREMLAEHFVDFDAGDDRWRPVAACRPRWSCEQSLRKIKANSSDPMDAHRVADGRIGRHAALEFRRWGPVVMDFADEIELRQSEVIAVALRWIGAHRNVGDQPDEQRCCRRARREIFRRWRALSSGVLRRGWRQDPRSPANRALK